MKEHNLWEIEPLGSRVIVRKVAEPQSRLIYTPEVIRRTTSRGEVTAVGPLCTEVKPGDFVAFSPHVGSDSRFRHEVDGCFYATLLESEIDGILTGVIDVTPEQEGFADFDPLQSSYL